MSQVELARRIGRHQTAIGPYERDEYEPPRDVVEKLALVLETSPEYLYFGRSPLQIALPVVGRIGRAGLLEAAAEPTLELVQLRDQQLRGYRVRDDSMAPVFRPGQLALTLAGAGGGAGGAARARCAGRARRRAGRCCGGCCRAATPTATTSLPTTRPFYPWSRCKRPDPSWVCCGPRLGASRMPQRADQEHIPYG